MRWLALGVFGVVATLARPAAPCATAPPQGKEAAIADEEAVIVWDAGKHVEHFIRKAAFRSNAAAFGFLVPTPTTPELGEVDDGVFRQLLSAIAPKQRTERSGFEPGCMFMAGDLKSGAEPVRVIQTAHVAGFDATTLAASDPSALTGWLGQHGFAATPALTAWLDRYVANHWQVTAFVVAGAPAVGGEVATRSVRMSFSTDRPFYPYREPISEPRNDARLLRVFVIADQRYAATLGDQPWVGKPFFAAPIALPRELAKLAGDHPIATVFEDPSSPRLGTDEVYFAPSPDQSVVYQPDVVRHERHEVPLELIPVGLLVIVVAWWILHRRRS